MNVKRFFAPTAREALRELKEMLGADAIVLSNRAVEGGVEILALPGEAIGALQAANRAAVAARTAPAGAPAPASPAVESRPAPVPAQPAGTEADFRVSLSALAANAVRNGSRDPAAKSAQPPVASPASSLSPSLSQPLSPSFGQPPRRASSQPVVERGNPSPAAAPAGRVIRPFAPPRIETPDYLQRRDERVAARAEFPAAAQAAAPEQDFDHPRIRELQHANARLMEELSGIRGMIERQLAGFAWGETQRLAPARAALLGELLESGFSSIIARQLIAAVAEDASRIEAREAVGAELDRLMPIELNDDDLIDRGGVYALVGPTGVGKTTTTAKLAARCVVRHGAGSLALITTDGYRIGAQEQLRIYGRILGVPVFAVRDGVELRQTLNELRNKHMVLIDTMGLSQRDRQVAEQSDMLRAAGKVRRLLLLNATARGDTLDDVVRAYGGPDLAGCIFTKVDEAASLAPALDVAIRQQVAIRYLTNGQRVPEDLHLPNRAYLLHRALREQSVESPWHLGGDETGLMLAAAGG